MQNETNHLIFKAIKKGRKPLRKRPLVTFNAVKDVQSYLINLITERYKPYTVISKDMFKKYKVLKFIYDAKLSTTIQSENRNSEIHNQLDFNIKRETLNAYLRDFMEKGLIELADNRPNAYIITNKGMVYHESSSWSRLSPAQKIAITSIVVASVTALIIHFTSC